MGRSWVAEGLEKDASRSKAMSGHCAGAHSISLEILAGACVQQELLGNGLGGYVSFLLKKNFFLIEG